MAMIEDSVVLFSPSALRYQEVSKMMGESLFMMTNYACGPSVRYRSFSTNLHNPIRFINTIQCCLHRQSALKILDVSTLISVIEYTA